MRKRRLIVLGCIVALAAAIGIPVALATGDESPKLNMSTDENTLTHNDPDPSTDPQEEWAHFNQAGQEGDQQALKQAAEEMRQEMLSRDTPEQREAAEATKQELNLPPNTETYIPSNIPQDVIDRCRAELASGEPEVLCELEVLNSEGKVRTGAFTAQEQNDILDQEGINR